MIQYSVLCIEDESTALATLKRAFHPFEGKFKLFCVESVRDAYSCLDDIRHEHRELALVVASQSVSNDAAKLLIELEGYYPHCRKILICDPNELESILIAVNEGRLDHCFTKPLNKTSVTAIFKKELTAFILSQSQIDWLAYGSILDSQKIIRAHIDQRIHAYRDDFIRDYHSMSDDELSEKVCTALANFFAQDDETRAIRKYSPSHLLTKEGEPNQYLWFITQGEVALYKYDEHGKQREVVRHSKGGIIGGMSFVTGENSFSTAITLSPTSVIKLSKQTFTKVMHSNSSLLPLFTNLLLRHFNRRLQRSIHTKLRLQNTYESLEAAQTHLIENEKMVVLGQLVAGVAHELNNPIAAILRSSDTLMEEFSKDVDSFAPLSKTLGKQVLARALLANPKSTAELRKQTKSLAAVINKPDAKKVVQMGLEDNLETLLSSGNNLEQVLNELEHYHTSGATLRSISVCAKRIGDMVKSLKSYARAGEESIELVDIHEGIEDTLVIFENKLKHLSVEKQYDAIPPTFCQPIALQQVWTNLISNAIDAINAKGADDKGIDGKLTISTRLLTNQTPPLIEIIFTDNGCGIEAEQQVNIFDLNYTTKKEGDFGLGIGLSVCEQIVRRHKGSIGVESTLDSGTKMIVRLPFKAGQ